MHLETSMSFATSVVSRTDGDGVVVAERRGVSSDCSAMSGSFPSGLLDVHQERLELWRLRVGVADEGREGVGDIAVLRHALEAPMDRNSDRVNLPSVTVERLDALGDHRHRLDE